MKCCGNRNQCTNEAKYKVTKKGDLSHREALVCEECVKPYRDSEDGKKFFDVGKVSSYSFGPSFKGSKNCESGSIASGGNRSYCSCDICF